MNGFLSSGIALFIVTTLFGIWFMSIGSNNMSLQVIYASDKIIYINFALWTLSVILSSIGMKKRGKTKQQEAIIEEKKRINQVKEERLADAKKLEREQMQEEEIKKLKDKVEKLEKDKEK